MVAEAKPLARVKYLKELRAMDSIIPSFKRGFHSPFLSVRLEKDRLYVKKVSNSTGSC